MICDSNDRPSERRASPARRVCDAVTALFSSVTFGVALLVAILVYASVFSALAPLRGVIETTEMRIFQHWVFVLLVALFCNCLSVATWRRILHLRLVDALALVTPGGARRLAGRITLMNVGVLTVHSGLLLLVGGALWYFGTKVEGDVVLRSPRIELVRIATEAAGPLAVVPVEVDQGWSQTLPAFGGAVAFLVKHVAGGTGEPLESVDLAARVGETEPLAVRLTPDRPVHAISERLALRLVTFPPESTFYDDETAALFVRKVGAPASAVLTLEGLPLHRERYLDEGYVLQDSDGHDVPSKRTWPHVALGPLRIPTGWFEEWGLPIRRSSDELPFDIEVTGYVPYLSGMRWQATPGGADENPAINYEVRLPGRVVREPLLAFSPAHSASRELPIEFRWVRTAAEREALFSPLIGPHELSIEVRDPPVRQTVAVSAGQTIHVEGTPYELTIDSFLPSWELASAELKGAATPAVSVSVSSGTKRFQRTVLQRFPEYSQDIDEQGKRRTDGPYDANLVLRYRTSADGWIIVAAGPGIGPELGVFHPEGSVERVPLSPGVEVPFDASVVFKLVDVLPRAQRVFQPVIEPLRFRRPSVERQVSAIRLKFVGKGALAGWTDSQWCMFSQYAGVDWPPYFPVRAVTVTPPGSNDAWEVVYSRKPHELGVSLLPGKLSVEFFPGRNSVSRWRSDFGVIEEGRAPRKAAVYTNQTHTVGRWTLFQSGADGDHWAYTVLGVGNRGGIWPMLIGCVLVTLGSLYVFYVKPAIRRRRTQRALAQAAADGRIEPRSRPRALPVEVGT